MVGPGFLLAFAKGKLGTTVTWIGGTITVELHGVRVVVKESIVLDILEDLTRIDKRVVLKVRSYNVTAFSIASQNEATFRFTHRYDST